LTRFLDANRYPLRSKTLCYTAVQRWVLPQITMERRPGIHRAPIRIAVGSGRAVLALGGVAFVLGHGGEALTLAGVLALAGVRAALAGALALAGVGADALTFAGGVGHGRHGRPSQEQGGCSGSNRSAGFGSHLHEHLLHQEVERCATPQDLRISGPTGRTQR